MYSAYVSTAPQVPTLSPQQLAKDDKASRQFEGVFLGEMMSQMFNGVGTDPLFGGGQGEKMFNDLLVRQYGQKMANTGQGVGVASALKKMMIQMQENIPAQHS
ncbi:MAG: rod-binding protein [Alphaproteobacteria bacterium]|nr:rod-binding protein [Alphaproteobacteria bacterium]MDE2336157.1 rod-binding protein [Alphaproteobacteria bacterium]